MPTKHEPDFVKLLFDTFDFTDTFLKTLIVNIILWGEKATGIELLLNIAVLLQESAFDARHFTES